MLMLLAGLQSIAPELYEAARIDGAKSRRTLSAHITLPGPPLPLLLFGGLSSVSSGRPTTSTRFYILDRGRTGSV